MLLSGNIGLSLEASDTYSASGTLEPSLAKIRQKAHFLAGQARILLRWVRLSHIEVIYEELVHAPLSFDSIWDFLSINTERRTPTSNLRKIRKDEQAGVISNYEEGKRALEGTAFANLLNCTNLDPVRQ